MAPAQSYPGPMALGHSKYASPQQRKATLAALSPAVPSPVRTDASTIATKEQIAAVNNDSAFATTPPKADVELAIAQGNALKEEVDRHAAKFSRTVSSAVTNTRQLLGLIRESMQNENATDLKTVEDLWAELEQLFAAASEAKAVVPAFLEKQRNNISLYHASMMNETIRDTQQELSIQHKKVNIQHNLILEHQEAFQDYKAQTAAKLKELEDLHERVSRLTLEKGNFRTEIDKYKQLLETERSTKAEDLQKADALQKELEALLTSKSQLLAKTEALHKALNDLQEKMKAAEQQSIDRFRAELKEKADQLAKETQKTTSLNVMINAIKGTESTARMEADKAKLEYKTLDEKYKFQSAEHAQAFTKLKNQTKQIDALAVDVGRFQKENAELKQRLAKLSELEKQNSELYQAKSNLLEQVGSLTTELGTVKDEGKRAKTELDGLMEKIKKLDREVDNLETENNDLLSKQAENNNTMQAFSILKNENSRLKAAVDELKAKSAAPAVDSSPTSVEEKKVLEEKISSLEETKSSLETALHEWTDLATRSYKEYKDILPAYKQGEQYRMDALDKDNVIKGLKLELSAAKALQSNGVGAGGDTTDAAYWKDKYESLLSTVGG